MIIWNSFGKKLEIFNLMQHEAKYCFLNAPLQSVFLLNPVYKMGKFWQATIHFWVNNLERTITARQGATPLEIGFALQRLGVTQSVAGFAAKRHQSAHEEVVAVPLAVDRYAGIHAVVRLQLQGCGGDGEKKGTT